ncbi:TerB family tellurite resistance protein [Algoriphagus sp. Y33]|uniref:TerB family tellurite resistance protein n=1 Tax=Algoriphagus sp. Y33 TaxID=2772483 RepID=UPI001783C231|nr:TerB family tellurite resistance protein [Algoriphagus sp. Y33]|tara:strand:- start:4560 stop:5186 length:627 start_codon:yes stop_codon:yes gene_type:complete
MKKLLILLFPLIFTINIQPASAQADEIAQLLLNVTKLSQLKQILSDLEKGYNTLNSGYSQISNIASGNFTIHEAFLDGLLQVNPTVKNYYKVAEIISFQIKLVKDYKSAFTKLKNSGQFTSREISYLSSVYNNLFKKSLQQLDELTLVLTANRLRMSDEERLAAIDQIHTHMQDQLIFLIAFNQENQVLAISRIKANQEVNGIKNLYQ